jgi:hypothetical protein
MSATSDRLYDHFQRERATSGRWIVTVTSLCAFYLLVFQPYLATLRELDSLDRKLAAQAEEIADTRREIAAATGGIQRASDFMGDASAYQDLYDRARSWVDDIDSIEQTEDLQARRVATLREALPPELQALWRSGATVLPGSVIRALRDAHPDIMRAYESGDDCFFLVEIDWIRCEIDVQLEAIRTRLDRVLYDRTASHEYTQALEASVSANRERYEAGLPDAVARAEIAAWVREYLEQERNLIRRWFEDLARERQALQRREADLHARLEQHETDREALEARQRETREAGRLETPVGALPLSFHGVLALLPLVMLLAGTLLLKSERRLLALRLDFEAQGPDDETRAGTLRLTMPLWLDPARGSVAGTLVLALFVLLVVAAAIGLAQLAANPLLRADGDRLAVVGIVPLTLGAGAVYVGYLVSLARAWRRALVGKGRVTNA